MLLLTKARGCVKARVRVRQCASTLTLQGLRGLQLVPSHVGRLGGQQSKCAAGWDHRLSQRGRCIIAALVQILLASHATTHQNKLISKAEVFNSCLPPAEPHCAGHNGAVQVQVVHFVHNEIKCPAYLEQLKNIPKNTHVLTHPVCGSFDDFL